MKNKTARFKKISFPAAAVCGLLVLSGISVFAQRPIYPIDRRVEQINRQEREMEREAMKREMKGEAKKSAEEIKRARLVKAQIREDLEALQTEYNKIVLQIQAAQKQEQPEPSRDFVQETSAAVKKHAARLKTNLALPEPEKEVTPPPLENPATIRKSLMTLCKHIYNFVTNPIFETPTGINVEQATKASRELDLIILLSESINENRLTAEKQK